MCACTGNEGDASSASWSLLLLPLPPRAVRESNVGGAYATDVDLRIVMSCKRRGEKGRQRRRSGPSFVTHPPSPRTEILQRVPDDFHAVAEHAIQIELLVFVYHCRKEEDQPPAGI